MQYLAGAAVFKLVLGIVLYCNLGKRRAWGLWMAIRDFRLKVAYRMRKRAQERIEAKQEEAQEHVNDVQQSGELNEPGPSDVQMTEYPIRRA
jgi:hypothetical protein